MPQPKQPITDDSIQVRQLSHYQFSWVAGDAGKAGTWTLQLVLDEGAWEEVLTVDADDADNLQDMLVRSVRRALRHRPPDAHVRDGAGRQRVASGGGRSRRSGSRGGLSASGRG